MGTSDSQSNTLLVRHLPSELDKNEKEELFSLFGAVKVKVMGLKGPMKHTAFVTFKDHLAAEKALSQLHQLEILGGRLVAEFARNSQSKYFPSLLEKKRKTEKDGVEPLQEDTKPEERPEKLLFKDNVFKRWSMEYPRNPKLHYLYPPPTVSIVTNIANALASYPKFYVQVLHLMNKMNLPAPFGHVTSTPPIPGDKEDTLQLGKDQTEMEEMEVSSGEESEMESDKEETRPVTDDVAVKRPLKRKSKLPKKKRKVVPFLPQTEPVLMKTNPSQSISTEEAFEQSSTQITHKRISLKLPETVTVTEEVKEHADLLSLVDPPVEESGGFGKLEPAEKPLPEEIMKESDLPYTVDPGQFLSKADIDKGRISKSEMKNFSVFKNYESGEPTSRLYIKNLAKHSTEQDLVNIYGRFVNWEVEIERNIFDIRLMKEGRMKGQAFVTFANEKAAQQALKETNAFVLNSKPMAVQFARSAKAKDAPTDKSSKK